MHFTRREVTDRHTSWHNSTQMPDAAIIIAVFSCWIVPGLVPLSTSFITPRSKKSGGVRPGDLGGHSVGPPLPIQLKQNFSSSEVLTVRTKWGGCFPPLVKPEGLYFMQDGAPPHIALTVCSWLIEIFPNRSINFASTVELLLRLRLLYWYSELFWIRHLFEVRRNFKNQPMYLKIYRKFNRCNRTEWNVCPFQFSCSL